MHVKTDRLPRKKFVIWVAIVSLFAMIGAAFRFGKIEAPKTVRMLTREGKLVEINIKLLASYSKKVSDKDLLNWINKK